MAHVTATLWEHQKLMVEFAKYQLENHGYVYWLSGCTTGKTLAALKVIEVMGFKRTLVLCTKAAIPTAWAEDIRAKTTGFHFIELLKGTSKEKAARMRRELADTQLPAIVAVNYETARMITADLKAVQFDFIISDESHKLAAPNSKVSIEMAQLAALTPYKMAMTGTGWEDRPTQLFGQLRFMTPQKLGKVWGSELVGNWYKFFENYVVYYTHNNIKIPRGYKNLDRLRSIIEPFTMDILTEDVVELPEAIHIRRVIEPTPEIKQAYQQMQEDMIAHFGEDLMRTDNVLAQSMRLHQLTGGFYTPYVVGPLGLPLPDQDVKPVPGSNPKLEALMDIVDELGNKPFVVFTRFSDEVRLITEAFKKQGLETRMLVGGCHEHVEWQAGDGQALIANISAGSAGVNLSRARYCIYYSMGHSRTDYMQSLYRIRRKGSDLRYPITYFYLLMGGTIDQDILNGMGQKAHIANQLREGLRRVSFK